MDQTVSDNLLLGAYLRLGKHEKELNEDRERILEMFPVLRQRLTQPAGFCQAASSRCSQSRAD